MSDWESKKLESLLAAGQSAISRARYVFLAINVTGILFVGGMFNEYLPWIRNVISRKTGVDQDVAKILKQVRHSDLETITILGLKFSVIDLSVLGAAAMAVLVVWYRYALRRENLVVHEIWTMAASGIDKDPETKERASYLYHAIAHYFVFLATQERDSVATTAHLPRVGTRLSVRLLEFMPAWIPLLAVATDIMSLIRPSEAAPAGATESLWSQLGPDRTEAVLRLIVGALLAFFNLWQSIQCYKYHKNTLQIVDNFRARVGNGDRGST